MRWLPSLPRSPCYADIPRFPRIALHRPRRPERLSGGPIASPCPSLQAVALFSRTPPAHQGCRPVSGAAKSFNLHTPRIAGLVERDFAKHLQGPPLSSVSAHPLYSAMPVDIGDNVPD